MGDVIRLRARPPASDEEFDDLAERVYALRALQDEALELAGEIQRQFVEDDLVVKSGPRKGQPLTRMGRQRRLEELLDARAEWLRLLDEERVLLRRAEP